MIKSSFYGRRAPGFGRRGARRVCGLDFSPEPALQHWQEFQSVRPDKWRQVRRSLFGVEVINGSLKFACANSSQMAASTSCARRSAFRILTFICERS